jgi:thiol-disulfide isomerase/thioredoxin
MKKILLILFAVVLMTTVFVALPSKAEGPAINDVKINYFWGDGCPHCEEAEPFLAELEQRKPNLEIRKFEVWKNRQNARLMGDVGKHLQANIGGVPFFVIGDKYVSGFNSAETTGQQIEQLIEICEIKGCIDVLEEIGANNFIPKPPKINENLIGQKLDLPLFGEIDASTTSLIGITTAIAFLDGFNPCAMWVLLFLITLLLGMEDKRRRWILGLAFIIASGAVYFLFMAAWLNFFLFVGMIAIIRVIIGLVAVGSGYFSLRAWWRQKTGCVVEKSEKRKRIFDKLRDIVVKKNFWIALIGIIILAAAVNLVELMCSAGFPAIYTQILTLSDLPAVSYYAYLLWYIIIFMIDDIIVFVIAMVTLQAFGISNKYALYVKLVGGIIILVLGLLLLFKPELLMFG